MTNRCQICGKPLSESKQSMRYNCGGDCMQCMVWAGDPDCAKHLHDLQLQRRGNGLSKYQQQALKRVHDRDPSQGSYMDLRRTVRPTFGLDGAVCVPWCGMWLLIETDGYTHS